MTSLKPFAGYMFAGAMLSAAAIPTAHAAVSLVVNNKALAVQTPTLPVPPSSAAAAGISYKATGAQASALTVHTEGFLFCANLSPAAPPPESRIVTLIPAHESQGLIPAHAWTLPTATDVVSVAYRGSVLSVNRNRNGVDPSSLTCHGVGADGGVGSGLTEGIFDHPFEKPTANHYKHLVNWMAPGDFDWTAPANWGDVPVDPCSPSTNEPAQIVEDAACVAATGVRGKTSGATRAATMWTASNGSSFTYVFRFDARYGPQLPGIGGTLEVPSVQELGAPAGAGQVKFGVRDAFDSTYLGASGGHYCLLSDLPAPPLTSTVCAGSTLHSLDEGPLQFEISLGEPPAADPVKSFYVAVTRPIVGGPPDLNTPVAGVAVFVDPVVSDAEVGGDQFSGDNVVFGFMPASTGFPWMSGQ